MAEMDRQRGERIRQLREAHSWTQRQLADRLGVDPKTVHNWEAGRELNPSNLRVLAEFLSVTPDFLRYGEKERPDLTGMFSADGDRSQLDRIEENQKALFTEIETLRAEAAETEARLVRELRSLGRKRDTAAKASRSQPAR